jgi:hypothetical protein
MRKGHPGRTRQQSLAYSHHDVECLIRLVAFSLSPNNILLAFQSFHLSSLFSEFDADVHIGELMFAMFECGHFLSWMEFLFKVCLSVIEIDGSVRLRNRLVVLVKLGSSTKLRHPSLSVKNSCLVSLSSFFDEHHQQGPINNNSNTAHNDTTIPYGSHHYYLLVCD